MAWIALFALGASCNREAQLEPIVEYPRPHCPEAPATQSVRVKAVTLNLRHDLDQWERRFAMIADEIVRLDPDVLGLQEVMLSRDQANVLNRLVVERGHTAYEVYSELKPPPAHEWGEGLTIMSRWPMKLRDSADIGDGRVALFVRLSHPSGGELDVYNAHFDAHRDVDGEEMRDREALRTVDFITKHDECRPTLLIGDMNSQAGDPPVRRFIAAAFDDSFAIAGGGAPGNTLRITLADGAFSQKPTRRVDFVLARSAGHRVATPVESIVCFKNHDARGFYPSDHYGVMSTFDVGF